MDSPGDHGLIHRALAVDDRAIDGHRLAGPHAETIADLHLAEDDDRVILAISQAPRRLGREIEQRRGSPRLSCRGPSTPAFGQEEPSTVMTAAAS